MGEKGVANDMTTHIGVTIGSFRASKETESHYIPQCRKSVFRVIENRHAVSEFREISPFMTHHLEFRMIPGCIIMSRSFHNPKLRFIRCLTLLIAVEMEGGVRYHNKYRRETPLSRISCFHAIRLPIRIANKSTHP